MADEIKGAPKQEAPKTLEEIMGVLIDKVEALTGEVENLKKTSVKKSTGLFGGNRAKTAIKDTTTQKIYPSKAAVGRLLAGEFGLDVTDNFAWYKIFAKAPDRFVDASEGEAKKAWAEQEATLQKSVDEANKKLAAEQVAKKGGKK